MSTSELRPVFSGRSFSITAACSSWRSEEWSSRESFQTLLKVLKTFSTAREPDIQFRNDATRRFVPGRGYAKVCG